MEARLAVEAFLAVLCLAGEAVPRSNTGEGILGSHRKPQEGMEGKLGTVEAMEEGKKAS